MSLYALNLLENVRSGRLFAAFLSSQPRQNLPEWGKAQARPWLGAKANITLGLAAGLAALSSPVATLIRTPLARATAHPRAAWHQINPLFARFDVPTPEFGAAKTGFAALRQGQGRGLAERMEYRVNSGKSGTQKTSWLKLSVVTGINAGQMAALRPRDKNPLANVANPSTITTAFGTMDAAPLAQASARACWAFHLQHLSPALIVNGIACPAQGPHPFAIGTLACVIGRLDYIGSTQHRALTRYFARAQLRRDEFCQNGHYQPARSTAALTLRGP